jgi:hypothetical protein
VHIPTKHEAVAYLDDQHDNRHHVSPALRAARVDEMIELEVFCCTCSQPLMAHSGGSIGKPNVRSFRQQRT